MNAGRTGRIGEEIAAKHMQLLGMEILHMNFRCRYGEIDIIARDNDCIVFCEVKTRQSVRGGRPSEAVTARKRHKIFLTAQQYLQLNALEDCKTRFDVAEIMPDGVNYISSAMDATGCF